MRNLLYVLDYEAVWLVSGWRRTLTTTESNNTIGLVRDAPISNLLLVAGIGIYAPLSTPYLWAGYVGTDEQLPVGLEQSVFAGAWFYRPQP